MALLFLLLGAFLVSQALRLSMRTIDGGPGPGLFPLALGALLVALAGRVIVAERSGGVAFGNLRRVALMVVGLVAYTLSLESVGFVLATTGLIVMLLVAFNERHRLALAALGVAGVTFAYFLFYGVLNVPLPIDPWGLWR
jgi:hypothetical protein